MVLFCKQHEQRRWQLWQPQPHSWGIPQFETSFSLPPWRCEVWAVVTVEEDKMSLCGKCYTYLTRDLATENNSWVIQQSYIKTVNQKQTMWEGKFLYSYRACIRRTPILRPLTRKSTNPTLLEEAVKTNIPASTRGNGDEDSACHASGMKPTCPVPWRQEEAACPVIPPACYQRFLQTSKHFKR